MPCVQSYSGHDFGSYLILLICIGLLLKDLKSITDPNDQRGEKIICDRLRVAVLMSTLLYPNRVDGTGNILDKRQDLFKTIENAINKLGKTTLFL